MTQQHEAQVRSLHATQSVLGSLNSNEKLLEADQQALEVKESL